MGGVSVTSAGGVTGLAPQGLPAGDPAIRTAAGGT